MWEIFASGKFIQKLEVHGAPKWVMLAVITTYGTLLPSSCNGEDDPGQLTGGIVISIEQCQEIISPQMPIRGPEMSFSYLNPQFRASFQTSNRMGEFQSRSNV